VLGRGHVEDRLGLRRQRGLEVIQLVDENWRGRRCLTDDVGIGPLSVHRGRVGLGDRLVVDRDANALDRAPRCDGGFLRRARGMADERSQRGAGNEQRSRDEKEAAEDLRAGVAEQAAEDEVERLAGGAAPRLAEDRHDPERQDDEPGAEWAHVDELRARDHEPAEREQHERNADPARAEEAVEAGVDLVADVASVPAEPERNGEEDAEEDEREPDQLGMLLPPGSLRARTFLLPHAGRGLRA
jgi:hypothetical protein